MGTSVHVQSLSRIWLFCDPMDCSLPVSSIYGISQARILEWVTISFSRGSSRPRDWTHVSFIGRWLLTTEPTGKLKYLQDCYFVNWDIFDIYHHVSLRYTTCWFDTLIYCTIIAIRVLTNTCITSQVYHFFVVLIEILSFSKFDVNNTVLLFIPCISSSGFIY